MRRTVFALFVIVIMSVGVSEAQEPDLCYGPGRVELALVADQSTVAGTVGVWNSSAQLRMQLDLSENWRIAEVQIYVGRGPIPVTSKGNPILGKFPFKAAFDRPLPGSKHVFDLQSDLDFNWGDDPVFWMAVHCDLVMLDSDTGDIIEESGAWAWGPHEFGGSQWGWYSCYELGYPDTLVD